MSGWPTGKVPRLPTVVGAVVMAGGVFGASAMQRIPEAGVHLTRPVALVLAIVWAVSAAQIFLSATQEGVGAHTKPVIGSFAIGTWVAGTAVVARMLMLAAPTALWLAKAAFIVSAGLWAWFFPRALRNLTRILVSREIRPSGVILLSTVATQAVALMALRLYPAIPQMRWAAGALAALGAACYVVGLFAIIRRYAMQTDWQLAADWQNSNCILHGALSISGLTAITGGFLDVRTVALLWACTIAAFIVVESLEVARLVARLRLFGWRDGVLVYDASQWARNFTFGMFYAFTIAFAEGFDISRRHPLLNRLREGIADLGQYVVLMLLLAELVLLLGWLLDGRRQPR
jgi:hypothetical protein